MRVALKHLVQPLAKGLEKGSEVTSLELGKNLLQGFHKRLPLDETLHPRVAELKSQGN